MKICYLANSKGAHEKKWAEYFVNKGHEVSFISIDSKGNLSNVESMINIDIYNVPIIYFNNPKIRALSRLFLSFFIKRRIRNKIKKLKPDIIHAHSVQYGFLASNLQPDIPVVFTPMGSDVIIYAQKYFLYKYMARKAFKGANIITGDSRLIQNSGFKIGARKQKNYIIQNGVDRLIFHDKVEKGIIRKKFNFNANDKLILSTRLIIDNSNIKQIIKSFCSLKNENERTFLLLIYSYKDEKYYEIIKKYLQKNNLEKNVIDIGRVDYEEIPKYIADADIYISIPKSDSSPKSVYEAMSCGTPCVISNIEWTNNFIIHQKHAFLTKWENEKKIFYSMKETIYNDKLRDTIIANGKKLVSSKIDYHKNMSKMEDLMLDEIGK